MKIQTFFSVINVLFLHKIISNCLSKTFYIYSLKDNKHRINQSINSLFLFILLTDNTLQFYIPIDSRERLYELLLK